MTHAIVWIGVGLTALIAGAELLVRGGAALAARLGISPLLIGLTVVALGTSTPELAVGIEAAIQGNGSLAIGNIAGTNTVNIPLILGLSAALQPLAIQRSEEHTSELQSLMRNSYAVFCLKKTTYNSKKII